MDVMGKDDFLLLFFHTLVLIYIIYKHLFTTFEAVIRLYIGIVYFVIIILYTEQVHQIHSKDAGCWYIPTACF
jgi:hypothetical protein